MSGWLNHYSFKCQPVDYSLSPLAMRVSFLIRYNMIMFYYLFVFVFFLILIVIFIIIQMANTCWWYYIAKFTEFFDTLFFILRKKTEHVSTLHVIHHGCMPFSVWMGLKFAPGKCHTISNNTSKTAIITPYPI